MDEAATAPAETLGMQAALAGHIQALAQRPLTARMLVELEKTCSLVRSLIAVGQDPVAVPRASGAAFGGGSVSLYPGSSYGENPADYGYAMPAISTQQETFGAQAIRQLMELVPSLLPKPPESVFSFKDMSEAILLAKVNGDEALEADLRAVLRQRVLTAPDPGVPALAAPSSSPILSEAAE